MPGSDPSPPVPQSSQGTPPKNASDPCDFTVQFWGVRGGIPTPGMDTVRYGGNTSCVTMRVAGKLLIFDAGTGLRVLGMHLLSKMPVEAHLFFTHCHWDRIQGFPFFVPAFIPINRFHIHGASAPNGASMKQRLKEQMLPPNFPVPIQIMGSDLKFYELEPEDTIELEDVTIETSFLNYPHRTTGYRVSCQGYAAVYATDTLLNTNSLDGNLLRLARNADLLIYDANYSELTENNSKSFKTDWKDFTWKTGIEVAKAAGVKQLVMCHHDPAHDDDFLDRVEAQVKSAFPNGLLAREGMILDLGDRQGAVGDPD